MKKKPDAKNLKRLQNKRFFWLLVHFFCPRQLVFFATYLALLVPGFRVRQVGTNDLLPTYYIPIRFPDVAIHPRRPPPRQDPGDEMVRGKSPGHHPNSRPNRFREHPTLQAHLHITAPRWG